MIDINEVKALLCTIRKTDAASLQAYSALIENSISLVQDSLKDEADESEARVVMLAAARANLRIAMIETGDDISSFKAGDVSLSLHSGTVESARALLEEAKKDAAAFVNDNGFIFMGV